MRWRTCAAICRSVLNCAGGSTRSSQTATGRMRSAKSSRRLRPLRRQACQRPMLVSPPSSSAANDPAIDPMVCALNRNCPARVSSPPLSLTALQPSARCHSCFCSAWSGLSTVQVENARCRRSGSREARSNGACRASAKRARVGAGVASAACNSNSAGSRQASRSHSTCSCSSSPPVVGSSSRTKHEQVHAEARGDRGRDVLLPARVVAVKMDETWAVADHRIADLRSGRPAMHAHRTSIAKPRTWSATAAGAHREG